MSTNTSIQARLIGDVTIIDFDTANLDFRNADAVKSIASETIAQSSGKILLNLSHVTFMDSSGLSIILLCKRALEEKNQGKPEGSSFFGIYGLQDYVRHLVNATKLDRSLRIYESEDAALADPAASVAV
jgi:anti-anti-sigma factor